MRTRALPINARFAPSAKPIGPKVTQGQIATGRTNRDGHRNAVALKRTDTTIRERRIASAVARLASRANAYIVREHAKRRK